MVQVAKNPLGSKGARITSYITLPGRYLVYMPTINQINVSRRIEDETEKERLKAIVAEMGNSNEGYIIRTACAGQNGHDIAPDIDFLHHLWDNIKLKFDKAGPLSLLYEDLNLIFRSIRDLFNVNVDKLIVDSEEDYAGCLEFCSTYLPQLADKVELYCDSVPIFDHYGIELTINRSLDRKVWHYNMACMQHICNMRVGRRVNEYSAASQYSAVARGRRNL